MVDPFEPHRKRPLADHLADYRKHLEAKNDDPKHVAQTGNAVQAIIDGCEFARMADLSGSRLAAWLADLRKPVRTKDGGLGPGKSARTFNYYLTAAKGFTRWLVKDRRMPDDPFAYLARVNEKTDRRRERRDISDAELAALIEA